MKSLDEQIEYMREEIIWYENRSNVSMVRLDLSMFGVPMWGENLEMSKAILDTLLFLRDQIHKIKSGG